MESKIEKIEGAYDIPILKDKLNRVIDYLNSQDQEEICTHYFDLNNRCTKCGVRGVKDMIAELQDTPEVFKEFSDKNIRDDIPEGFVEINGKLHKMEDTPEEWEENRKEFSEYWANHSHEEAQEWLDKDKLGTPEYTMEECIKVVRYYIRQDTKAQELIYYIKQLLKEREREVLERLLEKRSRLPFTKNWLVWVTHITRELNKLDGKKQ